MPVCLILVMKDVTFSEDYPLRWGGHAPVNWAIFCTWIISAIRRSGIRTVPQALRLWANQVDDIFSFLVSHIPHFNFYDMYWSRRLDSLAILPIETR